MMINLAVVPLKSLRIVLPFACLLLAECVQDAGRPPLPAGIKGIREVYFVTDREPAGSAAFGDEASKDEQMTYGRTVVSIPDNHEIGELERPWQLWSISLPEVDTKHIVIADRQRVSADQFHENLRAAIDDAPERSAFVFVHGYNVSFDEAVLRTGQLSWDLKFRGPAITYSWPSAGHTAKYLSDVEMAEWTAPHLEAFLRNLRSATGARKVHLVAHSMGGRVLTRALERITHSKGDRPLPRFQEVVLAAPDINAAVFAQLAPALEEGSDRVTIYSSSGDLALRISAAIRGEGVRVGGTPAASNVFRGFDVIDATHIKASLLGHTYFAESSQLLNDLALLIKQGLGPDERSVTLERSGVIWVFKP